jgi:hypothetical protein
MRVHEPKLRRLRPKSSNYVGKIALPVFDGVPSDFLGVRVVGGGLVFLVPGSKIVGRTQIEWRLSFNSAAWRDVRHEQEFSSLYAPCVVALAASLLF